MGKLSTHVLDTAHGIDVSDAAPVTHIPDQFDRLAEIPDHGGTPVRTYHDGLPVPTGDKYAPLTSG